MLIVRQDGDIAPSSARPASVDHPPLSLGDLRQAVLDLSDALDRQLLDGPRERAAFGRGHALGHEGGYGLAVRDMAAQWRTTVREVLEEADPVGPERRESVTRRLTAAEAGERRDAQEHWRQSWAYLFDRSRDQQFVRQARATQPWQRSYEQNVALLLSEESSRQGRGAA